MVQTAPNPNSKTFHQTEFLEAGFNSDDVEKVKMNSIVTNVIHYIFSFSLYVVDRMNEFFMRSKNGGRTSLMCSPLWMTWSFARGKLGAQKLK